MPTGNWNLQWANHNAQRKYPLADTAAGRDRTGGFALPDSFLIAADFPVHAGVDVDPAQFFVKNLGVYPGGYTLVVGYQPADGSAPVDAAAATVPRQAHVPGRTYALGGIGAFADGVGKVAIGALDAIDRQPPGFWEFDFEATRFDPDAIRPMLRGVVSLVCVNGEQESAPLSGVIELTAGANCQLVPIGGDDPEIVINFLAGEGTVEECVCAGDASPPPPITRIMGVPPTPEGDFYLIGGDCIRIEPVAGGLRITDTCATPCCGCAELEAVTRDLERLGAQVATLDGFVGRLQTAVETMDMVVLGARLGDRGCASN